MSAKKPKFPFIPPFRVAVESHEIVVKSESFVVARVAGTSTAEAICYALNAIYSKRSKKP